jgi:hypothetical protein
MRLRRTAVLPAVFVAVLAAVVSSTSAIAGPTGHQQQVCLVTTGAHDHEQTVRRPSNVVDELVENTRSYSGPCAEYGQRTSIGHGTLTAYTQSDGSHPIAIGLIMTDGVLDGLPTDPASDGHWCYDKDGNGTIDRLNECSGGYENVLQLGSHFQRSVDTPFTFLLANWNPFGHIPVGVYNVPHFDVHFYMVPNSQRTAIRPGPCPVLVNCDDHALGKLLPAAKYLAPDFADVDAVEPGMGNHLIDPTGPEFNGQAFTHTWIYGVWNHNVTFYEPMITHQWFSGMRGGTIGDACFDFKQASSFQKTGWYPTKYCLRHRASRQDMTVSLENFVHHDAS